MQVQAHARYVRLSPRKMRLVADTLRGMNAQKALTELQFVNKEAAEPLRKLLNSAIANAEHNFSLDRESLRITGLTVDGGPVLKRYEPRAYGRAVPIRRRTSHVTVVLEGTRTEKKKPPEKEKAPAESVPPPTEQKKPDEVVKEKEEPQFKVPKKVGRERKPSFVRRIFRRKSM